MNTVSSLQTNNGRSQPYHTPLKMRVIEKGITRNYTNNQQNRSCTRIGLCDTTGAILAECYDGSKLGTLSPRNTVMIRNYIHRDNRLIITSQTIVSRSADIGHVDAGIEAQAKELAIERDASRKTVDEIKKMGNGQTVSLTARVTRADDIVEKTLNASKEKVSMRNIYLKDNTGDIRLSLWRQMASQEILPGRFYAVSNVKTNIFKSDVSLNNTYNTRIEETQTPIVTHQVVIEGYHIQDDAVNLVCNFPGTLEYKDFCCTREQLSAVVAEEEDIDNALPELLPLSASITCRDSDESIIAITIN